jgi:cyanophycinase
MTISRSLTFCLAAAAAAFFALSCSAQAPESGNGYKIYRTDAKSPAPATPPRFGVVLVGGNGSPDEAMKFFCDQSGGGEIVVLRATDDNWMNGFFHDACPANSVASLVITSAQGANDPHIAAEIAKAHAIFISGGDQSHYVEMWAGNATQKEVNDAIARGIPIGGTSAGLAVLGQFVFSSRLDTVTAPQALANPYDPKVTLDRNFLKVPQLDGVITDSHFSQRKRMGRSVAFLARIVQDGWAAQGHGLGIDETTAVLFDESGIATVVGKGSAYFMTLAHAAEKCEAGQPLVLHGLSVYKLSPGAGASFDLKNWTGTGGTTFTVETADGKMTRSDQ